MNLSEQLIQEEDFIRCVAISLPLNSPYLDILEDAHEIRQNILREMWKRKKEECDKSRSICEQYILDAELRRRHGPIGIQIFGKQEKFKASKVEIWGINTVIRGHIITIGMNSIKANARSSR